MKTFNDYINEGVISQAAAIIANKAEQIGIRVAGRIGKIGVAAAYGVGTAGLSAANALIALASKEATKKAIETGKIVKGIGIDAVNQNFNAAAKATKDTAQQAQDMAIKAAHIGAGGGTDLLRGAGGQARDAVLDVFGGLIDDAKTFKRRVAYDIAYHGNKRSARKLMDAKDKAKERMQYKNDIEGLNKNTARNNEYIANFNKIAK